MSFMLRSIYSLRHLTVSQAQPSPKDEEPTVIECPECAGEGGSKDYFGEWSECQCCFGEGELTEACLAKWKADMAALDTHIDRLCAGER